MHYMHAHRPFYFSFPKMPKLSINTKEFVLIFFFFLKGLLARQKGKFDIHAGEWEGISWAKG